MDDDEDFVLVDELRKSRERLRQVPVMYGIDGYDVDLITWACERIEKLEARLKKEV